VRERLLSHTSGKEPKEKVLKERFVAVFPRKTGELRRLDKTLLRKKRPLDASRLGTTSANSAGRDVRNFASNSISDSRVEVTGRRGLQADGMIPPAGVRGTWDAREVAAGLPDREKDLHSEGRKKKKGERPGRGLILSAHWLRRRSVGTRAARSR